MEHEPTTIQPDSARGPAILTLDIGSSSVRTALFDAGARRIDGTLRQISSHIATTSDGGATLDPVELIRHTEELIDAAIATAATHGLEIRAVATTTFWHSLMGIDQSGDPITPVYTLADTRAASAVRDLSQRIDPAETYARTGARIHTSYPSAKLFWLRSTDPERYAGTDRWMSFGEYLFLRLFGEADCSTSMASGTGLFDQARQVWDEEILDAIGVRSTQLLPVSDRPGVGLRDAYAQRWPALAEVPWFPALGDGACGNVGAGAVGSNRLALMVGTTGAMRIVAEEAAMAPPAGLWLYRLDSRRVVLGGATTEGGNLFEWAVERLRLPGYEALEREIDSMAPDSHGLTWLPFLAGERSPGWNSEARATISGITLDTTSVHILRAGLESISYRFAIIADMLNTALPQERTVVACGNALLSSPAWLGIMADTLGCPVIASWEREASLRGAALYALEQIGAIDDLATAAADAIEGAVRYDPNMANHGTYRAAVERQRDLYSRLITGR